MLTFSHLSNRAGARPMSNKMCAATWIIVFLRVICSREWTGPSFYKQDIYRIILVLQAKMCLPHIRRRLTCRAPVWTTKECLLLKRGGKIGGRRCPTNGCSHSCPVQGFFLQRLREWILSLLTMYPPSGLHQLWAFRSSCIWPMPEPNWANLNIWDRSFWPAFIL